MSAGGGVAGVSRARKVAALLYAVPDELDSFESYERAHHLDVPRLQPIELWADRRRAELALALVVDRRGRARDGFDWLRERWLRERIQKLREAERRAGRRGDPETFTAEIR